ncbi:putative Oxygen-evolving enhancer protein 3-1, chloroplast precursor [Hibiscus syriacus]|uniref:Oxygen-evolving enhancer protein 3-1, chloroplast n=1 Tax=Hibiscus syriacus TaxID=106335 RepID=A0A6A2XUG0_HIBSY|nr:putative Oxygen-evolving enhancer protein 3-1, chloroplast precursor [Hibiscus syriacus]
MTSCLKLEVQTEDQTPHKWCISLAEDEFKRLLSQGNPTVHKISFLCAWDIESDSLLSNLRNSGKSSVDWFQTDQAYVLKAELPGIGKTNNVQIRVEKGQVVEIFGQLKLLQRESQKKDWRSGNWWEYGYVRRLELPEDAD